MENEHLLKCLQNRELSWLKFNERVLEEANCSSTPLLERLKFVSIFTSNLDEFFMIRVGSLTDLSQFDPTFTDNKTGLTAKQQLEKIYNECSELYRLRDAAYKCIMDELEKEGVSVLKPDELTHQEKKGLEYYFQTSVSPILSPQIIDSKHPFPHINNKQLYIAASLSLKDKRVFGIIPVPPNLERIYAVNISTNRFILIEDIILNFAESIFDMYNMQEKLVVCVTRNADINTEAEILDEDIDFRTYMQHMLKKRRRLAPVRLEMQGKGAAALSDFFCEKLNIGPEQVYPSRTPLDMSFVFTLQNKINMPRKRDLLFLPHTPVISLTEENSSILRQVLKRDIMSVYPFESMQPFLKLIRNAAEDKNVISIKITMYRINHQSKLAEHLLLAAENGKEVTVLMELRARFDEQNNIEWAQRLEEGGCRVIYGIEGYKVHAKVCLITRNEPGKIQYITQIGTGNYNEKTAKVYTDLSIITTNQDIGRDAAAFFKNMLLSRLDGSYKHLWVAPASLKQNILGAIENETQKAKSGSRGLIVFKINSLTDKGIIEKLVDASQAGVSVNLIVRGICCLVPGIPGLTENIKIISIVGRFLEHSRIYSFGYGDDRKIYISSADAMTRNMQRRVEVACPILEPDLKNQIVEMLDIILRDNVKAREQGPDGKYAFRVSEDEKINSQEYFMKNLPENLAKAINERKTQNIRFQAKFTGVLRRYWPFAQGKHGDTH